MHCKLEEQKKWHRQTTGTDDLQAARDYAENFYAEARVLERRGLPVISKKFSAVAKIVLEKIEQRLADKAAKPIYKLYPNIIKNYLIEFFGDYKIDAITDRVMDEFISWRR
jgi:integrase